MNILVLSPVEPYPPHAGGTIVIYHDLLNLRAHGHEVHLIANALKRDADRAGMEKICPTQYFYKYKPPRWRQVLRNIGNPLPFTVARHVDPRIMEAAHEAIRNHSIDIVLLELIVMGTYGPPLREEFGVPFFLRGHNVDTQILSRFVEKQTNPFMRAVGRWQRNKYARFESELLARADGFSMITDLDAAETRRLFPGLEPGVVEAGTDMDYFQPATEPRDPLLIAHVGSLTEFTKLEAMLWFCREVLPRVRAKRPEARLDLAGWSPSDEFSAFSGVRLLGRVDDVRPTLHHARVFIAPQFVGSGIRLKILNAMATANAIVCTPVACEGIPLVDGEHALIRESPADFAEAVLSLLDDGERAERMGRQARLLAERKYAWAAIVSDLERQMEQAIARRR